MVVKNGISSALRLVNSAMGVGGVATILYGVFMLRAWQLQLHHPSSSHHTPWVFHGILGVGIALCAVTCFGHVAASTTNITWLSTKQYIIVLLILLILETVIMAAAFTNRPTWKKELPITLLNRFDDFIDVVESYDPIWKWVGGSIFLMQAICILLATLRIQEPIEFDINYSEEEDEEEEEDPEAIISLLGPSARYPNIV